MSGKRLNKRQAREQQELEQLEELHAASTSAAPKPELMNTGAAATAADSGSEAEAEEVRGKGSIFAALGGDESAEEAEDVDDDDGVEENKQAAQAGKPSKKKKNKKKKKKSATAAALTSEPTDGQEGDSQENQASKKKGGASSGATSQSNPVDLSAMSLDHFDSILASQPHLANASSKGSGKGSKPASTAVSSAASALRSTLSLQQQHLDPGVELRRQFGSAAIKAYEAANGGTNGGGGATGARARMAAARNPNMKLRSVLVQPGDTWPPIARTFTGMSGELVDDEETGAKQATWEHSRAYKAAQYEFQQAVQTYEPNNIMALWRTYPWHVHLLGALSDISKHQGDLGQASDWNARILFAYERTAAPVFVSSLTSSSGPIPVDFLKIENRGLFLAAHKQIAFLGRKGTWRTALEWSKFLLGLDIRDPHAGLLWVDFLAIKSKQHRWFVDEFLPKIRKLRNLDWAAGIDFAEAIGQKALEKESGEKNGEKSTELLKDAIRKHPYILGPLYQKLGSSLPNGLADHVCASTDAADHSFSDEEAVSTREIVSQVYAARNESLWKNADLKSWLEKTVQAVWSAESSQWSTSQLPPLPDEYTRTSLYRHVLSTDMPDALRQSLTSRIPRSITKDASNLDAYDPVPPPGGPDEGVTRIDDEYFSDLIRREGHRRRGGAMDDADETDAGTMLNRLTDFLRDFQGRLPFFGGGGEGAGGQGQPTQEQARELMQQLMALRAGEGQGAIPGGFGDGDYEDEEEEGEESDEDESQHH